MSKLMHWIIVFFALYWLFSLVVCSLSNCVIYTLESTTVQADLS